MDAGPARVAVIGAGASGPAAAYELRRHGLDVTVYRPQIAIASAGGGLGLAVSDREIARRAASAPASLTSVAALAEGGILDMPGGVFIRVSAGGILGAVGSTEASTSLEDERAAVADIEPAGLSIGTGEV